MMHSLFILSGLAALSSAQIIQQIYSVPANNAGKKACITASSIENGSPVVISECQRLESQSETQDWRFSLDTRFPQGPQLFRLEGTGKCLDVVDGRDEDGVKLQVWDCVENSSNQKFDYHNWSWAGGNNKCIDLTDGNAADGNPLQLWSCSGGPNQQWAMQSAPTNTAVAAFLATNEDGSDNGLCLTAESNNDGAPVILAPCKDFSQVPEGNRTWTYHNTNPGGSFEVYERTKCLDIKDGNRDNGGQLQIWTCYEGSDNQQFNYGLGNIKVSGTNKCLDIVGKTKVVGARIELQECTERISDGQFWHDTLPPF